MTCGLEIYYNRNSLVMQDMCKHICIRASADIMWRLVLIRKNAVVLTYENQLYLIPHQVQLILFLF